MIIVIPMAGVGQRVLDAGYNKPKYKLSLAGSSVFSYAVRSFEAYFKKNSFLFIHRAEEGIERFIISECEILGVESRFWWNFRKARADRQRRLQRA